MLRSLWAPGTKLLCPERHLILHSESCFVFFPQLFAFLTTGLFDRGTRFSHDERSQNERPFGNIYPPGWRSSSGPNLTSRCSWSSWNGSAIYWAVCSCFSLNPIRSCVLVTETGKTKTLTQTLTQLKVCLVLSLFFCRPMCCSSSRWTLQRKFPPLVLWSERWRVQTLPVRWLSGKPQQLPPGIRLRQWMYTEKWDLSILYFKYKKLLAVN